MERQRRGGIYREVTDVSLEVSFISGIGGVEEDGSLFELEVPTRVSLVDDISKDISMKISRDGDSEGNDDILANC